MFNMEKNYRDYIFAISPSHKIYSIYIYVYTHTHIKFMHLADAFIQSDSGYKFFVSVYIAASSDYRGLSAYILFSKAVPT